MRILILSVACLLGLSSCGSEPQKAPVAAKPEPVKPLDESRRFPLANLVSSEVLATGLMGHAFMPGGTVGHFKKGHTEYEMFLAKLNSPTDAAILLLDWSKALTDAKLVPSFGGYFGKDGERPVFVFAKGAWITGIAGLPQKQADAEARVLASRIE
ncbi:MAG: hypothetical protein ABSH45_02155 [Bryobacteraceae bacterium]|jgi:hypothetical protein